MTPQELSDVYRNLNTKNELNKKAKKRIVYYINQIGFFIFVFSIIPIIPIILETFFKINFIYSIVAGLFLGLILTNVSDYLGKPWPPRLTINEKEFLKIFKSLKDIETYQKENIDFSRFEAAKKMSEVKRSMKNPRKSNNSFWDALIKENVDYLDRLKINFEERLLPNLIKGNDEDLKIAYSIIEKFAEYILNPTISELKELNRSLSELNLYPQEESQIRILSQIKIFFYHSNMIHLYVLLIFISSGYFVFHIGIKIGASIDTAYIVGTGLFGTLTAAYLVLFIARKR